MQIRQKHIASKYGAADASGKEQNDCSVRALANCEGIAYEEAHKHMQLHGRKHAKGIKLQAMHDAYANLGYKSKVYGCTSAARYASNLIGAIREDGMTVGKFLRQHPNGSFVLCYKGHAFAVKDGEIYDKNCHINANKRVVLAFSKEEF